MSEAFDRLVMIMNRLRDPGGCPWDREQTLSTLSAYLLEEAYEVVEAVRGDDPRRLCEELGDLLLQIVFMARIGTEKEWFDLDRVCESISDKLVRRHPHVFGDRTVEGADEVVRNWEDIKREERHPEAATSALDGVPEALPALLKAFRMTEKAAALGFDWRGPDEVLHKLEEEVGELQAELAARPGEPARVRDEMGDLLFVLANLARHLGIEPETALQESNAKFMRRFRTMEGRATSAGRELREMSLEELDELWEGAKAEE
jgi:MazG family protein